MAQNLFLNAMNTLLLADCYDYRKKEVLMTLLRFAVLSPSYDRLLNRHFRLQVYTLNYSLD